MLKLFKVKLKEENITWNSTVANTSKAGTYAYKGRVNGYPKKLF